METIYGVLATENKDRFVTLGLNEPLEETSKESAIMPRFGNRSKSGARHTEAELSSIRNITHSGTSNNWSGANAHRQRNAQRAPATSNCSAPQTAAVQPPKVPSRSPFATSVLGLNLSIEELKLRRQLSNKSSPPASAERQRQRHLSERLDTVFQGLKTIDENLLDELEEALIAAGDIGVVTTQQILETVRRELPASRSAIRGVEAGY